MNKTLSRGPVGVSVPLQGRALNKIKLTLSLTNSFGKENSMKTKVVGRNVAIMVVFSVSGLTFFTENVRAVQILGIFATGMAVGASLAALISALRAKPKAE